MVHDSRKDLTRSRAFLYGESVFTTMRVEKGHGYFAEAHRQRLLENAEFLWPGTLSQAEKLWDETECPGNDGVWRITLSAEQGGRGVRMTEAPRLLLDSWWTPELPVKQAWPVRSVKAAARPLEWPATLKTGDYLARLVAARKLLPQEIPLFHVHDHVCEFLHANFFAFDGSKLITPSLGPDVLAGIGRTRVLALAKELNIPVEERVIESDELANIQFIAAVNAVRGVSTVSSVDGRELQGHAIFNTLERGFFS